MDDSISKLAQLRVRKSKKSEEQLKQEYANNNTDIYSDLEWDDPYREEKRKVKEKFKPLYDRLEKKQS